MSNPFDLPRPVNTYAAQVATVLPELLDALHSAQPSDHLHIGVEVEGVVEDYASALPVAVPDELFLPIPDTPLVTEVVPELSRTLFELVFAPVKRKANCYMLFHTALLLALNVINKRLGSKRRWRLSSSPRRMPEYDGWTLSSDLPPLITPGNPRYFGLTNTPMVHEPSVRRTRHVPGIELIALDMSRFVGIHVNQGTSVQQFGPRERAANVAQSVVMALTEGTYLFNDQPTIAGFRNFAFPACTFGFGPDGFARHTESFAGGHPPDGLDGIRHCIQAVMASERPLFTIPPPDADAHLLYKLVDKLTYNRARLRLNPLRNEVRSPEGATPHDVTAVMCFTASAPDAVIRLIEDGNALPYATCLENDRAVHLHGINATISWPTKGIVVQRPVAEVAVELIEASAELHHEWGFGRAEIEFTHEPMLARARKRQTLAAIQQKWWEQCPGNKSMHVPQLLRTWGEGDTPVAHWPSNWLDAVAKQ